MNYALVDLFSFSVLIPAIIGWVRFKKMDPIYYPFVFCMWVAAINEIVSYSLVKIGYPTTINNNIYILLEALLITWQFKRWDIFDRFKNLYSGAMLLVMLAWILENLGLSSIHKLGIYFRLLYALLIVLLSINIMTWNLVNARGNLLKNSTFLIAFGYITFFTFKILIELFWYYGVNFSHPFSVQVFIIFTWINLFVNLLFAIAVLWIPPSPRYISF